ncbi:hypothetical protein D9M72_468870 [compost metagenome]
MRRGLAPPARCKFHLDCRRVDDRRALDQPIVGIEHIPAGAKVARHVRRRGKDLPEALGRRHDAEQQFRTQGVAVIVAAQNLVERLRREIVAVDPRIEGKIKLRRVDVQPTHRVAIGKPARAHQQEFAILHPVFQHARHRALALAAGKLREAAEIPDVVADRPVRDDRAAAANLLNQSLRHQKRHRIAHGGSGNAELVAQLVLRGNRFPFGEVAAENRGAERPVELPVELLARIEIEAQPGQSVVRISVCCNGGGVWHGRMGQGRLRRGSVTSWLRLS